MFHAMARRIVAPAFFAFALMPFPLVVSARDLSVVDHDPHRNDVGFFDIHVCNWPERPPFLMLLFSTTQFDRIQDIQVSRPDGRRLCALDLKRYRVVHENGKPEKRVFITELTLPADARDGWYRARVHLKDERALPAQDYVLIQGMPQARGLMPADGTENIASPAELCWESVPGAAFYQVYIKDLWADEKPIYTTALLKEPCLVLPPGLLRPGGLYAWRVHARDVNEHVLLGDFNHGSLSEEARFSIAP